MLFPRMELRMTSIEALLSKIDTQTVIDTMVDHGWFVGWTIAKYIVGPEMWDDLSKDGQHLLIVKVNNIKLHTPGLM